MKLDVLNVSSEFFFCFFFPFMFPHYNKMVQDIIFRFSVFVRVKGDNFSKKHILNLPSCFQDGRRLFLTLVCTLSPDCFDRLSSNFVQSLILLMGGSLLILGKID